MISEHLGAMESSEMIESSKACSVKGGEAEKQGIISS